MRAFGWCDKVSWEMDRCEGGVLERQSGEGSN